MWLRLKYRAGIAWLIGIAMIQSVGAHSPAVQKTGPGVPALSAVRAFYQFHFAHNRDFTVRNVERRKRWLTPVLHKLLLDELKREAQESKAHPDEAPYFEGDPFTDSQEYPDSFRVGNSDVNGDLAKVTVALIWSARTSRGRDQRDIIVEVTRSTGRWLISDIVNKDGNRLRDQLSRVR
jgi:hypothetical protein